MLLLLLVNLLFFCREKLLVRSSRYEIFNKIYLSSKCFSTSNRLDISVQIGSLAMCSIAKDSFTAWTIPLHSYPSARRDSCSQVSMLNLLEPGSTPLVVYRIFQLSTVLLFLLLVFLYLTGLVANVHLIVLSVLGLGLVGSVTFVVGELGLEATPEQRKEIEKKKDK